MKVQLVLIPIAAFEDNLYFYTASQTQSFSYFPSLMLSETLHVMEATRTILRNCFAGSSLSAFSDFEAWLFSERYHTRMVEVFDRENLLEQENSITIVRAISIPHVFANRDSRSWQSSTPLLSESSKLSKDHQIFLNKCLKLIPMWIKHTSFTFELLSKVFSIQDLRLLVSMVSNQEIDPGNFHRRLKKLDILRPLAEGQQRVHRWQFAWDKSGVLSSDGLIP